MANNPNTYERLPGIGFSLTHGFRLWQGPDHLLFVASSLLGERYKRFYFADIQAIVVRKTASWMVWGIVLLALSGMFGLGTLGSDASESRLALGGITLFLLIFLAVHALLGPTCRCVIRTAVQTEELVSLKRVRNADKVLARVRPLIESAQQPQPAPTTTPP